MGYWQENEKSTSSQAGVSLVVSGAQGKATGSW